MSEVIKKAATNEVVEFLYGDLRERSAPVIFNSATGNPVVFNDGANGLPVKSLKVNFSPIQNGSGDPSPENIRSIVPWEGLSVVGRGKNLFDENEYQYLYTDPDYIYEDVPYRCKYIQLSPNTTYTISSQTETTSDEIVLINNKRQPNVMPFFDLRNTSQTMTFTTNETGKLYIGAVNGNDAGAYNRIKECKIQIEVGSSATAYEPYHPITDIDIDFPSSVYGGTLDVVSGVLTVKWIALLGNAMTWTLHSAGRNVFTSSLSIGRSLNNRVNIISDTYTTISSNISVNVMDEGIKGNNNYENVMYIRDTRYNTAQEFNENVDAKIVYELAEPQTIQLAPNQITALFGDNVIWSDANGNVEVEYRADTGLFLKQNTVSDVQVVESSIVNNGIANIPYASSANFGVVKTKLAGGTNVDSVDHTLIINRANDSWIKAGANLYAPIVPSTQHISAFYALAKLAGADMAQSSNAVGTYTDPAKTAIQKMFGFDGILGDYELSTTASKAYAVGETFIFNGNRYRATTAIAINDVLAPGTNCVLDPVDGRYVKFTDKAGTTPGVVRIDPNFGVGHRDAPNDDVLMVQQASVSEMKSGYGQRKPIVPSGQHTAVYYALAKLAGADMASLSGETVGTYPQAQKTAIQTMLGIEADVPLVETLTGSTLSITGMPNVRYICETAISELTITPPASGSIVVRFTAGSNCIVSLPQTVKLPAWFDISSLEDGTTYEIIITDGVYGGVMSWA